MPSQLEDSQGARVYWNGVEIGTYISMSPSWQTGTSYDCTNRYSMVVGQGESARVVKQYNASSIEPGAVVVEFLGNVNLRVDDLGDVGTLSIGWTGFSYEGAGYISSFSSTAARGELIQCSITFQFNGFF
jgi:hypothetical protein